MIECCQFLPFTEGRFHWTSHVPRTRGRVTEEEGESFKSMRLLMAGNKVILACSEQRSTTVRV